MRRSTLVAAVTAVVVATLGAGCGADTPDDAATSTTSAEVTVVGSAGQPPVLQYFEPLAISEPRSQVVWPGTGAELVDGGPVLLNLYAQDGTDGTVLQNTFADAPQAFEFTEESLGSDLYGVLRGQRVGARLLYVEEEEGVPLVLLIDVLPSRADGEPVPPVKGVPTVTLAPDGAPTITIPPGVAAPTDIGVQPLVRGSGAQIEAGQVVTVRYTGVTWASGTVFDSNWGEGKKPLSTMIGVGKVIEGWDQGLLEQTVGSQVMVVVPPDLGYGGTASPLAEDTLVFVVDILDTHFPVTDEATDTEKG